ncbi:YbaK/EbsC family protein [Paludibacterium denitrificans]|uniref:YbaK/EbsC family protein n=1 Tax=Paludibacterium denitrificans TaxID=2675226 RepID=UPI001E2ED0F7|nr:YbaK/EbsC family protein [Paludibacterium denitrificans]
MSLASVRAFFAARQLNLPIIELEVSTATVALAAQAHGVEEGRIAKTLAFRLNDGRDILLVARGDARIDNRKFKTAFGKGKMLPSAEVEAITGHPVGGVCPFGRPHLCRFTLMCHCAHLTKCCLLPSAVHSAVRLSPGATGNPDRGTMGRCLPTSRRHLDRLKTVRRLNWIASWLIAASQGPMTLIFGQPDRERLAELIAPPHTTSEYQTKKWPWRLSSVPGLMHIIKPQNATGQTHSQTRRHRGYS